MTTYYSDFHPNTSGAKGSAAFQSIINSTTIELFVRSSSVPDKPNGDVTYTFDTDNLDLSNVTNNWGEDIPSGTDTLYSVKVRLSTPNDSVTITSSNWTSPIEYGGPSGEDAYGASLTNESHTLPSTSEGLVTSYSGASGQFVITRGQVDVSSGFTFSVQSNPSSLEVDLSSNNYSVTGGYAQANNNSAFITLRATGTGDHSGVILDKVFSLSKSTQGTPGITIITFRLYRRSASTPPTPDSPIIYNIQTRGATGITNSWQRTPQDTNGLPQYYTEATFQVPSTQETYTIQPSEFISARIDVQDGAQGQAAITGLLTNEAHTLPASTSGVVSNYQGATGDFVVFSGSTNVSSSFTLSTFLNEQGLIVAYSNQTYSITGGFDQSEDVASITIRATGNTGTPFNGVTINRTFTLSKSKAGLDGSPSKTLVVTSDRQSIAYDGAGLPSPTIQTTSFKAEKQNTTAEVSWTVTDAAGVARTPTTSFLSAATGDSVTMTEAQFVQARNGTTGVIVTGSINDGGAITDQASLVRVQDGQDGISPINVSPASISLSFSANAAGIITPSDQLPRTVQLTVMQGNTDLSEDAGTTYTLSQGNGLSSSMVGTNARDFRINTVSATSGSTSITVSRAGQEVATIPVSTTRSSAGTSSSDRIFTIGPFTNIPTTYSEAFSTDWQTFEFSAARTVNLNAEVFATGIDNNWFGKWQESILDTSTGIWGAATDLFTEEQAVAGEEDTFDEFGGIDTEFYPASLYSTKTRAVTASVRRYRFLVRRTTGSSINIDVSNGFIEVTS